MLLRGGVSPKALREKIASYVRDLLCDYAPSRYLRWSNQDLTRVDHDSKTIVSSRVFRHATANSWDCLPSSIRNGDSLCTLISKLKTHLLKQTYIDCTR